VKEQMYLRCTVEKSEGSATIVRDFWGTAEKCVVGKKVAVEEDDGTWTYGWTVTAVYGEPTPEKLVRHRSHDWTRQRKSSDI